MERIKFKIRILFDTNRKIFLEVTAELWNKPLNLALSSLLNFLFQHENELVKDDADFCYILAKCLKKVQIGADFFLVIPSNTDIAIFFISAIKHNIALTWHQEGVTKPIEFSSQLPLQFNLCEVSNKLVCEMLNRDTWLDGEFSWLVFSHNKTYIYFCNGIVVENLAKDLENFISNFYENSKIYFQGQEIVKFVKEIYSIYQESLDWTVQTDLSTLLPKEIEPIPLLSLDYNDGFLSMILSFQYEENIVEANNPAGTVTDKNTGKIYKRIFDLEGIYQQDLMALFEENKLPFMLQNPGDIARFLDNILPILKKREWLINSNVPEFKIIGEPVNLEFNIQSLGKDWFHFEPNCVVDNQRFSLQETARLLINNQGYLQTKKGFIKVTEESQKELEMLGQFEAFKVGRKFVKSEILPLISSANISGSDSVTAEVVRKIKNFHKESFCEIGADFCGELRPYQQYGLNWLNFLFQTGLGGVLADDMGLGKTVQMIAFISQLKIKKPTLVLGPTNVLFNWRNEINKFLPNKKVLVYSGANRDKFLPKIKQQDFIISTYGVIKNDLDKFIEMDFLAIFLDEAQYIKNPQTQVSKAVKTLKSNYKIAMTGTPIENHLLDLWSIFDFVMPNYLSNRKQFEEMVKDGQREKIKVKIKPFILRREKKEVLDFLPDKTEIIKKCPLSEEQMVLYQTVLKAVKQGIMNSHGKVERLNILTSLLKLRQVCSHPGIIKEFQNSGIPSAKFDLVKEMIDELIDEDHKVVVFSQFTGMLDFIQNWMARQNLYFERIDGSVSAKKRMQAIEEFQTSPQPGAFLISLKAGGIGINLTEADYVIHLDPWWNPAVEAQATDRVHRIGQKNKVIVYKLITEGTIEEKIFELQEEKKALISEIIDIDTMEKSKLDIEDLRGLF